MLAEIGVVLLKARRQYYGDQTSIRLGEMGI